MGGFTAIFPFFTAIFLDIDRPVSYAQGMERKGVLIPMLLALGAAAFYILVLSSKERALSHDYKTAQVLIARVDIPERTVVRLDMVEAMEVPRKFMMQDAFEVRTPSDFKMIANLVTQVRIPKGNQMTQSSLIPMSAEAGLAVRIPPGYRGISLGIEPELRELIKPGDRVDVMVAFNARMTSGRNEKVTATILQNSLVVAVGSDMGLGLDAKRAEQKKKKNARVSTFSSKSAISLALSPLEAQYLFLAIEQGTPRVIIRGLGDREMHPIPMSTLSNLFER